nr:hypothetical protein [Paenibacillus xylanexedens]
MSFEWWLNLVLTIPLAILGTIATQKLQTWQVKRKNKKLSKKVSKLTKEYSYVKKYKLNREEYREFLLIEIIKLIGLIVSTAIVAIFFLFGIFYGITGDSSIDDTIVEFFKFFIFLTTLFMLMLAFEKILRLEIQHLRIKDFENFENEVKKILSDEDFDKL